MNKNLEKIAETTDELESLLYSLTLPMSAEFHVRQIKKTIPKKIEKIRKAIIEESGENPWE